MTDQHTPAAGGPEEDPTRPRFVDKRRIDPETGQVRAEHRSEHGSHHSGENRAGQPAGQPTGQPGGQAPAGGPAGGDAPGEPTAAQAGEAPSSGELGAARALAEERLADLQRLQAEYVNYRKRVERDRLVARDQTVLAVVEAMLGVLDDIDSARQHGDLTEGPFAAIAEKLEATLGKFGWERYGEVGESFDPEWHEALMHQQSDDATETTVSQVLQYGHRVGERVVRAARVAVTGPGG